MGDEVDPVCYPEIVFSECDTDLTIKQEYQNTNDVLQTSASDEEQDEQQYIIFCKPCNLNFVNSDEYNKHNVEIHKRKQYLCNLCNSVFKRQDSMKRHLHNVHFTSGFCICPVCREDCKTRRCLLKHLQLFHSRKPQVFRCRECEFECGSFIDLEKHEKTHLPERKRFVCTMCAAIFRRNDHLRRHMRNLHSSYKCSKCTLCCQDCRTHSYLIMHIKKYHPDDPKDFKCDVCTHACGLLTDFEKPVKKPPVSQFPCQTCGKIFKRKDHLIRHVNGEHLNHSLPCPLCNRTYKRQESVIYHLRRLHKMDFLDGKLTSITEELIK